MKKKTGLLVACAGLMLTALGFSAPNKSNEKLELNRTVIVELKEKEGLSKEEVQRLFEIQLRNKIGYNYKIESRLSDLANFEIVKIPGDFKEYVDEISLVENSYDEHFYEKCETVLADGEGYDPLTPRADMPNAFNPKQTEVAPDKNYSREDMVIPESGNEGKGTLIAVLDNSFQVGHEAFVDMDVENVKFTQAQMNTLTSQAGFIGKGNTYINNKIPYVYDYANNDDNVLNTSENHGMHVSTIACANGTYQGISPKAQLAFMKVFPDSGSGASDSTVLKALNDCVKLKVDVINMSLGSPLDSGWGDRNTEDGKVEDTFTAAFRAIQYLNESGVQLAISAGNEGKASFIKDKEQTNDFGNYYDNALDNPDNGILGSYALSAYGTIVASGRLTGDTSIPDSSAYTRVVSSFSSEGYTYDLLLNPDIITPGTNIWGGNTVNKPEEDQPYVYMNGTSMAAPNYAGAVANLLSNGEYTTEEERAAYQKTLTQRLQSTAKILTQANGTFYTPKKQGAGQPNVTAAINSDVYFKGERDKAKVELKNNDDIKQGNIKFSIAAVNEGSAEKKFNAKLYVQSPALLYDDDNNPRAYSLNDKLLETYEFDVTLPVGTSDVSVNYTISNEAKEYLSAFKTGCFLEGYLVLSPEDENDYQVSVPYMGYYGDYGQSPAVEEFDFAADEGYVGASSFINSAYSAKMKKVNVDFTSTIVTSGAPISSSNIDKSVSGDTNLKAVGNEVVLNDDGNPVFGIDGLSNNVYAQMIILRTCKGSKYQLIDSDNKVVYENNIESKCENKQYQSTGGGLYKSLILTEEGSGNLYCSKAFASLQIRNSEGLIYPVGNYTLRFSFDTIYGSHIEKDYPVEIRDGVASSPVFGKKSYTDSEKTAFRIELENNIEKAIVNDSEIAIQEDANGKYLSIDKSIYGKKTKVLVELINDLGLSTKQLFNIDEIEKGWSVEHADLKATYSVKFTESRSEVINKHFTYDFKAEVLDARKNPVSLGKFVVNTILPADSDLTEYEIFEKQFNGQLVKLTDSSYRLDGNALSVTTQTGIIQLTIKQDKSKVEPEPTPVEPDTPAKKGCGGEVAVTSISLVSLAAIALATVLLKKKKNEN
jgi:hypothetical protein